MVLCETMVGMCEPLLTGVSRCGRVLDIVDMCEQLWVFVRHCGCV